MDSFDWNRSKEDLLSEMRIALSDVFDGTDYTIVRNPTQGEKMNNIYRRGSNKRSAFVIPLQRSQSFTFAFNTEYLTVIKMSGAKLGELKEIKKDTTDANLISEWDYEKNTDFSPEHISRHSMYGVWWKCPLNHSYKAKIADRANGMGCKVCDKEYKSVLPKLAVMVYAGMKKLLL